MDQSISLADSTTSSSVALTNPEQPAPLPPSTTHLSTNPPVRVSQLPKQALVWQKDYVLNHILVPRPALSSSSLPIPHNELLQISIGNKLCALNLRL
ncbi:unnamed protein product [Prunus armeniaca]|uniref:Uncharacterized protein n=1 Tax=Prunus armeniaca TaxID=36596 RepID=A0A6J5WYJ3_PRUAR|nr:unnamed protein product [Prunus armeniaca]